MRGEQELVTGSDCSCRGFELKVIKHHHISQVFSQIGEKYFCCSTAWVNLGDFKTQKDTFTQNFNYIPKCIQSECNRSKENPVKFNIH